MDEIHYEVRSADGELWRFAREAEAAVRFGRLVERRNLIERGYWPTTWSEATVMGAGRVGDHELAFAVWVVQRAGLPASTP